MKYIIILLTSLFLVSNSYSADSSEVKDFKSIADLCKEMEEGILLFKNYDQSLLRQFLDKEISHDTYNEKSDSIQKPLQKKIKNYHYLDCSDFRSESGRIE